MIFYMFLCLFMILLYFLTHISKKSSKNFNDKLFLRIAFIALFIVVGSREMTRGNDTYTYINLYKQIGIRGWSFLNINNYYENGYIIFNILLNFLSRSSRFFILVMSFIFNFSVYKFIKNNSENYLFSIFLYIGLLFFYQSMTMMRQFLALSIVLFAFELVKKKKFLPYLLAILFAALFHNSALIAIIIYPLYYMKYNKKYIIICGISAILLFISLDRVYPLIASFFGRETYYLEKIGDIKIGNLVSSLIYLVIFIFSIIITKDKNKYSFYNLAFFTAASICFVSVNMAVLSRASQYISIMTVIALPNVIRNNIKKNELFYCTIISCLIMSYASIVIIYRPEWNSAFDYKSCIFEKEGYICEK